MKTQLLQVGSAHTELNLTKKVGRDRRARRGQLGDLSLPPKSIGRAVCPYTAADGYGKPSLPNH